MKLITGATLAALLLAGCSGGVTADAQPAATQAAPAPSAAAPTPTPTPTPTPLTTADFKATTKTLSKQCFGSAGCNVDVRIELSIMSAGAVDRAAEVTVTVTGDESGPIVETLDVDSSGGYGAPEVSMSTASSGTKISAQVTDVFERP